MGARPGVMVMVIEVRIKPAVRERVEKLDSENRCVKCEKEVTEPERRKLGRCEKCYYRYRMDRLNEPKEKRLLFDAKLQRAGELVQSRQGQRLNQPESKS